MSELSFAGKLSFSLICLGITGLAAAKLYCHNRDRDLVCQNKQRNKDWTQNIRLLEFLSEFRTDVAYTILLEAKLATNIGIVDKIMRSFLTTKPTGENLSFCRNSITKEPSGQLKVKTQESCYTEFSPLLLPNLKPA